MSRPLHHRGLSSSASGREPIDLIYTKDSSTNGYGLEPINPSGVSRTRLNHVVCLLKVALVLIVILVLSGSLYWAVSVSSSAQNTVFLGYGGFRRLQEQLVADLTQIRELSLGVSILKEVEFCAPEFVNFVPCYYNVSETLDLRDFDRTLEYERQCDKARSRDQGCLVLPPKNYRIPLKWPTGRDFIWKENVKIKRHEFSSGSLTKR